MDCKNCKTVQNTYDCTYRHNGECSLKHKTKNDGQQFFTVEITRKEFLKLPLETRRRIISKQALLVCQKLDSEDGYKMME